MRPKKYFFLVILFIAHTLTAAQDRGGSPKANNEKVDAGNTYAMIFGISNYPSIKPLKYADKDAQLFKEYLQSPAGGNLKEDDIFYKINDSAKAADIFVSGLGWLKSKNPKRGDRLYFYFAGHGDAIDENEYYLLAYDCNPSGDKNNYTLSGTVKMFILKNRIKKLTDSGIHVILIIDACRSNELPGGTEGMKNFSTGIGTPVSEKNAGEMIMLSTGPGMVAIEDGKFGGGHGLFTYYLIDALMGTANAEGNKDGKTSFVEVIEYVKKRVRMEAEKIKKVQNPVFCCSNLEMETLGRVDSNYYKQWVVARNLSEIQDPNMVNVVAQIKIPTARSVSAAVDTQAISLYNSFNKALKLEKLRGDNSAEFFYSQLVKKFPGNSLTEESKYSLASEFINYGQSKINLYLSGKDISHFRKVKNTFTSVNETSSDTSKAKAQNPLVQAAEKMEKVAQVKYKEAADMMEKAIQMLQDDPDLTQNLYPKLWFLRAKSYHSNEDKKMTYDEALTFCRKALKKDPGAAYNYHLMGNLIFYRNMDSAYFFYKKARDMAPKWTYPYNGLGIYFESIGKIDSALYFYHFAIGIDSTDINAYRNLAFMYEARKDLVMAERSLIKAVEMDEFNTDGIVELGNFYYNNKRYEPAEKMYKKAVVVDPTSNLGYDNLVNLYLAQKKYELASQYFSASLRIDSINSYLYSRAGELYEGLKKFDLVEKYLIKATSLDFDNAHAFNQLGNFYFGRKKYDLAEINYKKALEFDSYYKYAYSNLGNIYLDQKKYELAEKNLLRSIDIDPRYMYPYTPLADLYQELKQNEKAEKYLIQAAKLDTANTEIWNRLGNYYYDVYNYEKAEKSYMKAYQIDPLYKYASSNLGNLYLYQKKYTLAEKYLFKSIESDPNYKYPYTALADLYEEQTNDVLLEKLLTRMTSIDSTDTNWWNRFGNFYYDRQKYDLAEKIYKRTLQVDSLYKYSYSNLGNLYLGQKKYPLAEKFLKRAIEIDPRYVYPYNKLADLYEEKKQYNLEEKYLEQATKIDSMNTGAWHRLGNYYYNRRKDDLAEKTYKKILELNPSYQYAYDNLGNLYIELKKYDLAKSFLSKSIELNPDDYYAYERLGDIFVIEKDNKKAEQYYKKAIQAAPTNSITYHALAHFFNVNDKPDSAIKYYNKVIEIDPSRAKNAYKELGKLYYDQGQIPKAESILLAGYKYVSMNNYYFIPELLVKIYSENLSLPKGCDKFLKQVAEIIYDEHENYIHDFEDGYSYQKPVYKLLVEYYCKYPDAAELKKYFQKARARKLYTESEIRENNCLKTLPN